MTSFLAVLLAAVRLSFPIALLGAIYWVFRHHPEGASCFLIGAFVGGSIVAGDRRFQAEMEERRRAFEAEHPWVLAAEREAARLKAERAASTSGPNQQKPR